MSTRDEIESLVDDCIRMGAALGSWAKPAMGLPSTTNEAASAAITAAREVFVERILELVKLQGGDGDE